jgi:YD repeat-containing protein
VHTESQYEYNKQRPIIRRTDRYQEAPLSVTTHTYEYNNAGQLTRYVRTGGAPRQSETNFEYDQSGYRVKMTQKDTYANRTVTFSRAYEYENGNLTREIYNPGLPDQTSIRYEYYSDKEDRRNQFPHSFLSTNWHSASKNIIRSSTVEPSNATVHFQYEYNAEGFPVKETRTHGNEPGSYADVILYEYDCQ